MEVDIENPIDLIKVNIKGEDYFKITNVDKMRPFFMSIVSDSDHWMFISSNTGLSAGRKNAQYALFPYYTDDKITESSEHTGSKTIIHITDNDTSTIWEPFSYRYEYLHTTTRNIYKSVYCNKIIFEEINHDLQLTFRYQWSSSDKYGFVKKSSITNHSNSNKKITILDGLQNIMPYGVPSDLQNASSNLVDAYKRSELNASTGLGIYALSAIIVDRAEPSEALKANVVWSQGLDNPKILLSSQQLDQFRKQQPLSTELDIKAEKAAYFVNQTFTVSAEESKNWMFVATTNQSHKDIAILKQKLSHKNALAEEIEQDITKGTSQLIRLVSAADGLQLTADSMQDARHFSNALFNIMRGGIFDFNYQIEKYDFLQYIDAASHSAYQQNIELINRLADSFDIQVLRQLASESEDLAFQRLCLEYLPLKFSRRHGDPSRPWNVFSINTRDEITGKKILDYQGNWRDIFQNWEALAFSFPGFVESMIHKFLNASTFEGYNPYRITKSGFDWEIVEKDNPWAYIGYWGDHQIIYLLKFLEFFEDVSPGQLAQLFDKNIFVYANVPYKIKSYEDILKDPKDTIVFDEEKDHQIRKRIKQFGADGALLNDRSGKIYTVNFLEKIIATILGKVSNFIPEGGIWLNTQRPEWNDANNALVGNGVSMVTLYYLYRFLSFFKNIIDSSTTIELSISLELRQYYKNVKSILDSKAQLLDRPITDRERRIITDSLGKASSEYRKDIYQNGFSNQKSPLALSDFKSFIDTTLAYFEHTIKVNRRKDTLYHAYNLMTIQEEEIEISYLYEMLEGQVAILSSGLLSTEEVINVLDALKASKLFRDDQYSYLLYPNKDLPRFSEKNTIDESEIARSQLLQRLIENNDESIVNKDINGLYHFNGNFKNANDLNQAMDKLNVPLYATLLDSERDIILVIFENVFDHKSFTGRSGTFFGYEGLGSIYWHMVSKLQLAVQECCQKAINEKANAEVIGRLLEHYYEINAGLGIHKSPELYGAFPTDPYSHTPANKGAQQPGMTGQVKEDLIARFGELGIQIKNGCIHFNPSMLRKEEFRNSSTMFEYFDVSDNKRSIQIPSNALVFSICQVPIIYTEDNENYIEIIKNDQSIIVTKELRLQNDMSRLIFSRTGDIEHLIVHIESSILK